MIAEGERLGKSNHLSVDWAAFADAWRGVYRPNLNRVLSGELPWTKLDDLHRISLAEMLKQFKIEGLSEDEIVDFKPYLAPAKALARFGSGSAAAEIALRGYDAF